MNILVTGGAGFIGSHIVDAYLELGHDVTVVDDLSTGSRANVNPKARFEQLDIRNPGLRTVFARTRFDVVNHHAAQMNVRRSVEDPAFDASVNVLGGLNVFELAREFGTKRIVFASTGGAIYGEQDTFPADESHPTRPCSPYGITKLATEHYLSYYRQVFGIESVILRYANVYGPRQNPHGEAGVVAIFAKGMLSGRTVTINGDGLQTRDYVFVDDVVRANVLALRSAASGVYNIGTGKETNVVELFQSLRAYLCPTCKEQHGSAKQGEQRRSVVSSAKIQHELGWSPQVSLEEGLKRTGEFFKLQAKMQK